MLQSREPYYHADIDKLKPRSNAYCENSVIWVQSSGRAFALHMSKELLTGRPMDGSCISLCYLYRHNVRIALTRSLLLLKLAYNLAFGMGPERDPVS